MLTFAGAGFEPTSGGYEPPEVPLLHPAMFIQLYDYYRRMGCKVKGRNGLESTSFMLSPFTKGDSTVSFIYVTVLYI